MLLEKHDQADRWCYGERQNQQEEETKTGKVRKKVSTDDDFAVKQAKLILLTEVMKQTDSSDRINLSTII